MHNNGFDLVDLYKSIIELSDDAITTTDLEGRLKFVSPKTLELHGYSEFEELIGRSSLELIDKEDWGRAESGIQETLSSGSARALIYTLLRKDGSKFVGELNTTLLRNKEGSPVGFMATTRDITDKMETEKSLIESEQKYRSLFDNPTEGIFVHSFDGKFVDVNRAACEKLGYTKEEILHMSLKDIDSESSAKLVPERMNLVKKDGVAVFNVEHIAKDGRIIPEEVSAKLFRYNGEDLIISVSRDISLHRSLEQQLQHAQKMELIGRLASGVAHSFNNLLTVIKGFATAILAQNGNLPYKEELSEIQKAATNAAGVVKQLLAFSRKQEMKPVILDANEIVVGLNKMLPTLIGKSIKINLELDGNLYKTKADPIQLEQVLINLAVNAKDAMNDQGILTIKTQNAHLEKNGHPVATGDYIQISVSDVGCGMSKEVLDHLFEPFFTTKSSGVGTGLGLSTAYGIIKQSNGYIFAKSKVGEGSTFDIYLPKVEI